jgi:hypothetical protein
MARSKRLADKERFWRSMVKRQRQGGATVRAFCREQGISEPSFYAWRKELQRRDGERSIGVGSVAGAGCVAAGESEGRLIPVEVIGGRRKGESVSDGDARNQPLEVGTPGGFTLRFDPDTRPETVLGLLEVIAQCSVEGAASC